MAARNIYKMPILADPETPEAELVAKSNEKSRGLAVQAMLKKISGPRRSAEEMEKMSADLEQHVADTKPGDHARIFVAVGQKVE